MKNKEKKEYTYWSNIKFLINHINETDKKTMPILVIAVVPPVVLQFLNVVLVKVLVDSLTNGASLSTLVMSIAVFVVCMVAAQVCLAISQAYRYPKIEKTFISFSKKLMVKALNMDYENLESLKGRHMLEQASNFVSQRYVGMYSFCYSISDFLTCILGIFSFGAIISMASPYVLILNLIMGVLMFLLEIKANREIKKFREESDKIFYKAKYLTSGMPTEFPAGKDIRVYGISRWFSALIKSITNDYVVVLKRLLKGQNTVSFLEAACIFIRDGATLFFLLRLCIDGKMSPGDFFLYITVVRSFSTWFQDLAFRFARSFEINDRCTEARRFLDLKDNSESRGKGKIPDDMPCSVEFKNVSFSYDGEKDAVKNISFKVKPGEKIAIVGSNGAGKTTAMKLLSGLYTPKSGQVLINGAPMTDVSRENWFDAFSALFQDTFVLPGTIIENVSMRSESETDMEKFKKAVEQEGIAQKIDSLPEKEHSLLNRELFEKAVNLSGGEMQRIFLARALYKDAPIVILDEPTSALDPIAENELYLRYNEMTKEKTSFYISHRLSSTGFCDRIFFFKDGELFEEGSHEQLMEKKGEYYRMYETQSYYYREYGEEGENDEQL